jgi:hypothetical protein
MNTKKMENNLEKGQLWVHYKNKSIYKIVSLGMLQFENEWYKSVNYLPMEDEFDFEGQIFTRTEKNFLESFIKVENE